MLNCCINGMKEIVPDNEYVGIIADKVAGYIVAEAADTEDVTAITEAMIVDKTGENKKPIEDTETDLENAITDNIEQTELIDREPKKAEVQRNTQKGENGLEKIVEEITSKDSEKSKENGCIYNVSFPTNSRAYLDPENLSGKGQIFSDEFKVENYGNTDVTIKIKSIEVYYRLREELYELSEGEVMNDNSYIKKLNVDVVWKNKNAENVLNVVEGTTDEEVLFLESAEFDENGSFVGIREGSIGSFYFTGTLNSNPELVWEDGEITLSFDYEIVNAEEEETEKREENQEEKQISGENVNQEKEIKEEQVSEENINQEEEIKEEQINEKNVNQEKEIKQEQISEENVKQENAGTEEKESKPENQAQPNILESREEVDMNNKGENPEATDVLSALEKVE